MNQLQINKLVAEYVKIVIERDSKRIDNVMLQRIADAVYPGNRFGYLRIKRHLKMNEIQTRCNDALTAYYINKGLTVDVAIDLLLSAKEKAIETNNVKDLLAVYDRLAVAHNLLPAKRTVSESYSYVSKQDLNKAIKDLPDTPVTDVTDDTE